MVLVERELSKNRQIFDEELTLLSQAAKMQHPEMDANWELFLDRSDEILSRNKENGAFVTFTSKVLCAGAELHVNIGR